MLAKLPYFNPHSLSWAKLCFLGKKCYGKIHEKYQPPLPLKKNYPI